MLDIDKYRGNVEPRDAWRVLKASGVKFIKFTVIDINGRPRAELMPIDPALDVFRDGMPFDGSSIPSYTTVNKSDFVAVPDNHAIYVERWNDGKIADVLMNVIDDSGKPVMRDPRNVLLSTIYELQRSGLRALMGVEVEFFIVNNSGGSPALIDDGMYFEGRNTHVLLDVAAELTEAMSESGIGETKIHHEVAPSQYEVNIPADSPIKVADNIVIYKVIARDIAKRHGYVATFMPKPFWGINGSGAHTHISMWDLDGRNLFESKSSEATPEAQSAIAGLLAAAKSISAVVAPTVNSYKRLVPHHEAPTRIAWGYGNRSAMIRIPFYGRKVNRFEYRHPDPSMNPYLAFAVELNAVMNGLSSKASPPPPVEDIAYELNAEETPRTLGEAVAELRNSPIASIDYMKDIITAYADIKEKEWNEYESIYRWDDTWSKITEWEYSHYLGTA